MVTNADIKLIKSLEYKKFRKLHLLFVIEGERLISEAVLHKASIKQLFITEEFISKPQHHALMDLIVQNSIIASVITEKEMKSISSTVSPSGILAICEITKQIDIDTAGHNHLVIS